MKILTIFLTTLLATSLAYSQPQGDDITLGQAFTLKSTILDQERPYLVYLPEGYSQTGEPASVLYLLDGGEHFHHTTGIVSYLANRNLIPKMMVVAIPNFRDRAHELTPPVEKDNRLLLDLPTAGGANKTLDFLRKELIPHIDKQYNTTSYRTLVGHSFGGLFVVNTLLSKPEVFDSYIAISPSLWWDDQRMQDRVEAFFKKNSKLEGYFYMTLGDERKDMVDGVTKFADLLKKHAPKSFEWKYVFMENETHGSIPHRSTYEGLEAIFKENFAIDMADLFAKKGINGLDQHFAQLSNMFGHEMKIGEMEMNALGYQLVQKGNLELAAKAFQKNVENYPRSYNVYDSMAECYMMQNQKDKAIEFYKKSMEMHPGSQNGVAMLKRLGVDYDAMSKAISLTEKEMKEVAGTYASPDLEFQVKIVDGKLVAMTKEGTLPQQELIAFPKNTFLLKKMNAPLELIYNEKKEVSGFEMKTGIGEYIWAEKTK